MAWHKTNKRWSADYASRLLASMNNHIFPAISHLPATLLKTQHFTTLLRNIEEKGFLEVTSRSRHLILQVRGRDTAIWDGRQRDWINNIYFRFRLADSNTPDFRCRKTL